MTISLPQIAVIDDDAAEAAAVAAAVAEARTDRRGVSHEDMRAWLLRIAAGEFMAEPPALRDL
jgi:hypothetical protein